MDRKQEQSHSLKGRSPLRPFQHVAAPIRLAHNEVSGTQFTYEIRHIRQSVAAELFCRLGTNLAENNGRPPLTSANLPLSEMVDFAQITRAHEQSTQLNQVSHVGR